MREEGNLIAERDSIVRQCALHVIWVDMPGVLVLRASRFSTAHVSTQEVQCKCQIRYRETSEIGELTEEIVSQPLSSGRVNEILLTVCGTCGRTLSALL